MLIGSTDVYIEGKEEWTGVKILSSYTYLLKFVTFINIPEHTCKLFANVKLVYIYEKYKKTGCLPVRCCSCAG